MPARKASHSRGSAATAVAARLKTQRCELLENARRRHDRCPLTLGGLSARPLAARHPAYTISPSAEKGRARLVLLAPRGEMRGLAQTAKHGTAQSARCWSSRLGQVSSWPPVRGELPEKPRLVAVWCKCPARDVAGRHNEKTKTIEQGLASLSSAGFAPSQWGPTATAMYCLPLTA